MLDLEGHRARGACYRAYAIELNDRVGGCSSSKRGTES